MRRPRGPVPPQTKVLVFPGRSGRVFMSSSAPRRSRTPPSANLGSLPPSSSSEARAARAATRRALSGGCCASRSDPAAPAPVPALGVVVLGGLREAGPGASWLRGARAAFGRRTAGRERRHLGLNAEQRRRLRVRPEAQRRRGRGGLREPAAAPAPRAPRGVDEPLIGRPGRLPRSLSGPRRKSASAGHRDPEPRRRRRMLVPPPAGRAAPGCRPRRCGLGVPAARRNRACLPRPLVVPSSFRLSLRECGRGESVWRTK